MALRIRSGFKRYLRGQESSDLSSFLYRLKAVESDDRTDASFWSFSRDAVTDVNRGFIDMPRLNALCEQKIASASQGKVEPLSFLMVRNSGEQEETWQINVVFSAIPHVKAGFIERATPTRRTSELDGSETLSLVEADLAHVVFGRTGITGLPIFLYIDQKISKSKKLSKRLSESAWSERGAMTELLGTIEPEFRKAGDEAKFLARDDQEVHSFLQDCDKMLLSVLGTAQMDNLVGAFGIPLEEWVRL